MKILLLLLKIRCLQFWRILKSVGWGLLLIALPLLFVFGLRFLDAADSANPYLIAGILVLLLMSLHFQRKDVRFLKLLGPFLKRIFLLEYNVLLLPISICLLAIGQGRAVLLTHLATIGIVQLPLLAAKINTQSTFLNLNFLPTEAYEWKSGIRRYVFYLIPFYVAGLATTYFIGGSLIITIIMGYFTTSFYDEYEPKEMLEVTHFKYGILTRKAGLHSALFHLLMLPYYVLFLVFHGVYWYLLLVAILVANALLLFALFYKYALYVPNRRRVYNQNAVGFFSLGFLIPFFLPGSLGYLIWYGIKARQRLNYFYKKIKL